MPKLVQSVIGLDFNALYLFSIMQDMPTGMPEWWHLEGGRLVRKSKTMAERLKERRSHGEVEHLKFREWRDGSKIYTAAEGKQISLSFHRYRVDGYSQSPKSKPVVYNYNGCYYHGHRQGCLQPLRRFHEQEAENRQHDLEQQTELKARGVTVVTIWECEWMMVKKMARQIQQGHPCDTKFKAEALKYLQYSNQKYSRQFQNNQQVEYKDMLRAVVDGRLFGFLKVDIYTPDHLKELYEDFPPLIKHADVRKEDLGPYMERVAEENNCFKKPRDALIGSYFGEGIWLMTPLIKFYHEHGLEIRAIHDVVQYDREKAFQWFGDTVTEHRKQGDADKDKAILAEVYKLLGNSAYGKCITNLRRHMNVIFADSPEMEKWHNEPRHKRTIFIEEDAYEIQNRKEEIKFELPMVIGLAVYNYAKLKMLAFLFDVLLVCFSKDDYLMLESDTDSIYLGLSAGTLEEVVRPDRREEWDKLKVLWFVQDDSQKRTPGYLKVEKEADSFIGLCSKTYICVKGDEVSVRAKGAQARNKHIFTFENFRRILFCEPGAQRVAFNMGIRPIGNKAVTYVQEKQGLTPVYCKRRCLRSGYTLPLNI